MLRKIICIGMVLTMTSVLLCSCRNGGSESSEISAESGKLAPDSSAESPEPPPAMPDGPIPFKESWPFEEEWSWDQVIFDEQPILFCSYDELERQAKLRFPDNYYIVLQQAEYVKYDEAFFEKNVLIHAFLDADYEFKFRVESLEIKDNQIVLTIKDIFPLGPFAATITIRHPVYIEAAKKDIGGITEVKQLFVEGWFRDVYKRG